MRGIAVAWLVGIGILTWREVAHFRQPPPPGRLAAASGVFAGLALLAEHQPAAAAAALAAWGFDLAVLLQVLPQGIAGQSGSNPGPQGGGGLGGKPQPVGGPA